ncbi:MAG: hypothetical protein CL666_09260 [Balneola sp.]|nr:hypothetical protein [Balneola sp.]|tara:strand:- start:179165 stop:179407 length:243 start_codon:yes stop_codon:yes gene_type:complete
MKAIELKAKTDEQGSLKIDHQVGVKDQEVRVLVLIDDQNFSDKEQEEEWVRNIANNPSFDFLNDPAEEVYSIKDGKPIDD